MTPYPAIDASSSQHAIALNYCMGGNEHIEVVVDAYGIVIVGYFVGDAPYETVMLAFNVAEA